MKYLFKCYIFYRMQNVCMENDCGAAAAGRRGQLEIMQSFPWWCDYSSHLWLAGWWSALVLGQGCGLVSCDVYCYSWCTWEMTQRPALVNIHAWIQVCVCVRDKVKCKVVTSRTCDLYIRQRVINKYIHYKRWWRRVWSEFYVFSLLKYISFTHFSPQNIHTAVQLVLLNQVL